MQSVVDSVEAVNADLRHYLARLGRRPRCCPRCIEALRRAVDLFVRLYNTYADLLLTSPVRD